MGGVEGSGAEAGINYTTMYDRLIQWILSIQKKGAKGEICRGKGRGKRGMETGKGEREVECATD
jgi:hypothetical protein